MQNKTDILEPDFTYHVYNRTNGKELLFTEGDNCRHFLEKYIKYIVPIAETYCYCLMPNHFHFLIRIRSEGGLKEGLPLKAGKDAALPKRIKSRAQETIRLPSGTNSAHLKRSASRADEIGSSPKATARGAEAIFEGRGRHG